MIKQYAAKRADLKALGDFEGLAKLPRNSSPTRWKNRCVETGDQGHICANLVLVESVLENTPSREKSLA